MRLHASATSPYARKVRVALIETGQAGEVEIVAASGTPLDASAMPLEANPLGKIPVLERPDGPALYDSRVICRYLDHRAEGGLYPAPPALWEALTLEATAEGMLDAAVAMIYEARLRPAERVHEPVRDAFWQKIARSLEALEARWLAHLKQAPGMAQLSTAIALDYLDLRHSDRAWRGSVPALAEWHAGISARPSLRETAPPPG